MTKIILQNTPQALKSIIYEFAGQKKKQHIHNTYFLSSHHNKIITKRYYLQPSVVNNTHDLNDRCICKQKTNYWFSNET